MVSEKELEDIKHENMELKRLIQEFLYYGTFYHFEKKRLWKMGFQIEFPRQYKWMREFVEQSKTDSITKKEVQKNE